MPKRAILLMVSGLILAGSSGYLASQAISAGDAGTPITTTINVATGETGPAGPAGPPGPAGPIGPAGADGGTICPTGYIEGRLVINHPGGQTSIWTCIFQ
jgi:hypothetical protein